MGHKYNLSRNKTGIPFPFLPSSFPETPSFSHMNKRSFPHLPLYVHNISITSPIIGDRRPIIIRANDKSITMCTHGKYQTAI